MRARRAFAEDVGERVSREVADKVLWEAPHHAAAAAARPDVAAPSPTTPSENGGKVNVSAKEEEALALVPASPADIPYMGSGHEAPDGFAFDSQVDLPGITEQSTEGELRDRIRVLEDTIQYFSTNFFRPQQLFYESLSWAVVINLLFPKPEQGELARCMRYLSQCDMSPPTCVSEGELSRDEYISFLQYFPLASLHSDLQYLLDHSLVMVGLTTENAERLLRSNQCREGSFFVRPSKRYKRRLVISHKSTAEQRAVERCITPVVHYVVETKNNVMSVGSLCDPSRLPQPPITLQHLARILMTS
ncbi:hypothetical protein DIPPA_02842 [Diplonema papillatum]|nr:hypothetical protein DIPPA_02842 [Diplonema papillatum]